jgi:hypothetical protein
VTHVIEHHYFSNAVVALLVGATGWLVLRLRHNEIWLRAANELWRRRPIALLVLGLYLLVGLLDAVAWVDGEARGDDVVAAYEAQTIIDLAFGGRR